MSLINKMLQDLEQRQSGGDALGDWQGQVRAAEARPRGIKRVVVISGLAIVLAGGAGVGAWWLNGNNEARPAATLAHTIVQAPSFSLKLDYLPPALPSAVDEATPINTMLAETADTGVLATAVPVEQPENKAPDTRTSASEVKPSAQPGSESRRMPAAPPASGVRPNAAPAAKEKPHAAASREGADEEAAMPVKVSKHVKELTSAQRAENEYRRALTMVEQGKRKDALSTLEQALHIDFRHAAARQALAALLVDEKRPEEAVRILNEGLAPDRAQVGMAMMLARLQVDRQDVRAAIETLRSSLSYAMERADYRAFMAALLQREARHKEAIDHYLAALGKAQNNGIWWMGIGISLQAESRVSDAREAFGRAKTSGTLSPELLAFVEQRLAQLR